MRNFCGNKEHGGTIFTGSHTGAAANAGCCGKRSVSQILFHRQGVGIHRVSGIHGNVSACLHDPVKCRAVHDQVFDYRESVGAPGFNGDGVPVFIGPHMELTGGISKPGSMWTSVNVHRTGTADTFPAIVIESNGLLPCRYQPLIQYIHHFQERHFRRNIFHLIGYETASGFGVFLPPHFQRQVHFIVIHVLMCKCVNSYYFQMT